MAFGERALEKLVLDVGVDRQPCGRGQSAHFAVSIHQARQESKVPGAFILRSLLGFDIEVNPVEPIPPVVFIELQDFPNMPALGQQPLICISSLIAPSGSVVERSCQGSAVEHRFAADSGDCIPG